MLSLIELIFRLFVPVSDAVWIQTDPTLGMLRVPGQEGVWMQGDDEIKGHFAINQQGWNAVRDYASQTDADLRIAVIGDSFVEALQVDVGEGFPAVIEASLNRSGECGGVQVDRFGMGGAPLSQYPHTISYVRDNFTPDLIILMVYYNDFHLSYEAHSQQYASQVNFWRYDADLRPVPPDGVEPNPADYLLLAVSPVRYAKTINRSHTRPALAPITDEQATAVIQRGLTEIKQSAGDTPLIIAMERDRGLVYGLPSVGVEKYQQMVQAESAALDLDYLDLGNAFAEDFARHGERFEFDSDWHWNERGHQVVGNALAAEIAAGC